MRKNKLSLIILFLILPIILVSDAHHVKRKREQQVKEIDINLLSKEILKMAQIDSWTGELKMRLQAREEMAKRIDNYLSNRNSPLMGKGNVFAIEGEKRGINPYLSVAIAGKESYFGANCFAPYNAWGMLAYNSGFSSWEEGIIANFDWLQKHYGKPQTAYDCPGYCVPNQPWMQEVQAIIYELERGDFMIICEKNEPLRGISISRKEEFYVAENTNSEIFGPPQIWKEEPDFPTLFLRIWHYCETMSFKGLDYYVAMKASKQAYLAGYDPRLWAVIAMAESSGGRGSNNYFGFCGSGGDWAYISGSWETQLEAFHNRIINFYVKYVNIQNPEEVLWFHHEGEPLRGRNPYSIFYVRNIMSWLEAI